MEIGSYDEADRLLAPNTRLSTAEVVVVVVVGENVKSVEEPDPPTR